MSTALRSFCLLLGASFLVAPATAATRLFVTSGLSLSELDPLTGSPIGTLPITGLPSGASVGALAFDAASNTLFLSENATDSLYTLDYVTGVATIVGPYNVTSSVLMHGLAVDDTGQLYGHSPNLAMSARFFSVNRVTGQATPISNTGFASFGSLEFVASTGTLYFSETTADNLYTIDRATGALGLVGPFGVIGQVGIGMAYHPTYGMYATNNNTVVGLFNVNLATGAATLIASLGSGPIGLTFVEEPSTPSIPFCTGNVPVTTCTGCSNNGAAGRGCANSSFAAGTLLSSSGIASIAADTLVLTASDIPGPGLFFQADGLAASPLTFGDGMLCASVGIIRMGVVFPTPTFTASYPGGLTPNPIHIAGAPVNPGDTKHYQCWYRDSAAFCTPATFNTSNGISLAWGP